MGQFSSLVLQVALGCHHAYLHVYFIVTLGLFIYKGIVLPYPPTGAYTWDIIFLFLYLFIEKTRMFHASKGNRTKLLAPLVLSLVLTVPTTICTAYYLQLQTYVLRLELLLNGVALFFLCFEMLLSILTLLVLLGRHKF